MKETFGSKEKLKSKKEIELLFSEGKSISQYPIRLVYRPSFFNDEVSFKVAVSVSKRNFKKAVDRNRIKRLLREAYRKNKLITIRNNTKQFSFMFLYTGKEMPDYEFISSKMTKLLKKFVDQEMK